MIIIFAIGPMGPSTHGLQAPRVVGQQRVDADAWLKATASGHITFLADNVTVPFTIEKRVGASVGLNRIRYSSEQEAVIGNLQDLALHLGEKSYPGNSTSLLFVRFCLDLWLSKSDFRALISILLKMVATEATDVKISNHIFQNHDFLPTNQKVKQ